MKRNILSAVAHFCFGALFAFGVASAVHIHNFPKGDYCKISDDYYRFIIEANEFKGELLYEYEELYKATKDILKENGIEVDVGTDPESVFLECEHNIDSLYFTQL